MRTITKTIANLLLSVVFLLIIMVVLGRTERSMEIKDNLSDAVEETVEILTINTKYSMDNTDEFLADFTASIINAIDSDSEIVVNVENVDMEKGLLAVKVIAEFKHPNGTDGKVECEKTVILNKVESIELTTYNVRFYVNRDDINAGEVYKSYEVKEGEMIMAPAVPISERGTFVGWKDSNEYLADFTQPVTQDLIYYAEWN